MSNVRRQQAQLVPLVKPYLDTNLVSAIVRQDHPLEAEALAEIVRRGAAGELNLVTSKVTGEEIDRCTGPHAPAIQSLYDSMKKLPYVEYEIHVGFDSYWDDEMGGWSNPLYDVDPSWSSLRAAGLDETDAHHIMLALKGSCHCFLTCDVRTILKRRKTIEAEHNIRLLKPSQYLAQLQ
jgi:hypothetical protein